MLEWVIFLVCAYFAAAIATVAGFGSSTLLIPVAVLFIDLKSAVFIVACFHLFNNLFKVKLFFKAIDFKLFLQFGIPSILFAFLGAILLAKVDLTLLKKFLGVFLILFSTFSFIKPNIKINPSLPASLFGGSLSGFLAGLIGLGGAIRGMFLISYRLPKELYVATSALIAFVIDLTRIPTYLLTGAVDNTVTYQLLPILIIIAYVGVRTGKAVIDKIDQKLFHSIVLLALLLVGVRIFVSV